MQDLTASSNTAESNKRIRVVDLVRTISIIAVLANHFFRCRFSPSIGMNPIETFFWAPLNRFAISGAYGVSIFFVLSGFLIARMIAQRSETVFAVNCGKFYIRRIARILPLLLLIVSIDLMVAALCAFAHYNSALHPYLAYVFRGNISNLDWLFFLSLFSLTFNWLWIITGRHYGLQISILWSIAVEEQFYLLLPLTLRKAGSRKRFVPLLVALIALGPLARWLGNYYGANGFRSSFCNSFGCFGLIALGVLLFFSTETFGSRLRRQRRWCVILCLAGFALASAIYMNTLTGDPFERVYAPTLLGLGVFLFLLGGVHLPAFEKLPGLLVLPGELSYGLYLYHPLVLFLMTPIFMYKSFIVDFALYVIAVTVLGWLSYRLFEQKANRLIRQRCLSV